MLTCAIYARESNSGRQGDTIEHQIATIKEHAKRILKDDDYMFDEKFIYIDRQSGFKTTMLQRDSMKKLIDDIKMIDIIFFKGISRFARDSSESIATAKRLTQRGVRVISIEENYDSSTSDPTIFQIHAVFAESESRKNSIRTALGNREKAQDGIFNNGIPAIGYIKVGMIKDEAKRESLIEKGYNEQSLYPDERYAPIIEEIFDMYVNQNMGYIKIANNLNKRGIKTANGNLFYALSIQRILTNEVYIGCIVYGKTRYEYIDEDDASKKTTHTVHLDKKDWIISENAHIPIISKEIFNEAQKIIREKGKRTKGRKQNNAKYPLTGLLKCPKCGVGMIGKKRTKKLASGEVKTYCYYFCRTSQFKGSTACTQKPFNAYELERAIYNNIKAHIEKLKDNPKLYTDYAFHDATSTINKKIKDIDNIIQKRINDSRWLLENRDLYDEGTFKSMNLEYREEIKKLREQKSELEEQIKFTEGALSEKELKEKLDEFINVPFDSQEDLRSAFYNWINCVTVDMEKKEVQIDQKFKLPT